MLPAVQQAHQIIMAQESTFLAVNSAPEHINFAREAEFAIQHLQNNNYLCSMAMKNQDSLVAATKNVAAIGISLNPALKHAYLVPRDNKCMLDISYHGLLWLAMDAGAIDWAQAKIVYSNDQYENTGLNSQPHHKYNPFSNRGDKIGAYVTVKTPQGDYLTHEMPIEDIYKIRARSQSFKGGKSSPWKTDEDQMILKTVVKQASKYWPKCGRLATAEHYLNGQMNEGIDFKSEQGAQTTDATPEQCNAIRHHLNRVGREWEALRTHAMNTLNVSVSVVEVEDLSRDEASKIIDLLSKIGGAK
jgi:recombination protein RecT